MIIQGLALLHALAVIVFTARILLREDLTSSARLAWFMIMLFTPYLGVAAYLLFGEVNLGRTVHQRHDDIFDQLKHSARSGMGSHGLYLDDNVEVEYRAAFRAASLDGFETTMGNRGELLPDASSARARLIEDIEQATESVQFMTYIWLEDQTGIAVARALSAAAKRGIPCHAIADGLGSREFIASEYWAEMKRAGVKVTVALPVKWVIDVILFSRLDLRNHRKLAIIDSHIAWCGSQNCADPEFRVKAKFAPWVDIMLRMEGPVAVQCQLLFASDWMLGNENEGIPEFVREPEEPSGGFPAQIFADGPTERRGVTPQLFATLLALAKEEVVISTPYFVPSRTVLDALCGAANRGVTVTMIFPKRNDSKIVAAASRSYYRQLLKSGVRIFEFRDGLLHSKTLTIDGKLSLLGSTNLDMRSFDLNFENDILLRDESLTQEILGRQHEYIDRADVVTIREVNLWPYHRRIWNNVIATIGPVL